MRTLAASARKARLASSLLLYATAVLVNLCCLGFCHRFPIPDDRDVLLQRGPVAFYRKEIVPPGPTMSRHAWYS